MTAEEHYQETLRFLYAQLPMYQRIGIKALKKDLTNIRLLTDRLGNPHTHFPSIHIAGTNGKGSTSHMIAAVLQAAGLKVGLYTSPHYKDFRERIKINGTLVSKSYVVQFVDEHKQWFTEVHPSYFELTVAMAFDYFSKEQVDVAVIETGLGGRLDSTNILQPLLSVITNIDFDHMDVLGDTLEKIAYEKAGIIKPNTPVVIGQYLPETAPVFTARAGEENAPLYWAEKEVDLSVIRQTERRTTFRFQYRDLLLIPELEAEVVAGYQRWNLRTALCALMHLQDQLPIQLSHIREGLYDLKERTYFIGRWQVLEEKPVLIVADSAHNEAGIQEVLTQIKRLDARKFHFVLGMSKGKEHLKMLKGFPVDADYYFACPEVPRGLPAVELQQLAGQLGLVGKTYPSVPEALEAACLQAQAGEVIFVGGSSFTVAEVV